MEELKIWISVGFGLQAAVLAVVGWYFKAYLDRRLEEAKYDIRSREQAGAIAGLMAEWTTPLDPKIPNARRLNELYWGAVLWLPHDLVRELSRRFYNVPTAKHPKEILLMARRVLRKHESDDLSAEELIHFE